MFLIYLFATQSLLQEHTTTPEYQMHQSHNIPWHLFEEHTKFMAHQPQFPQRPPQLVARGHPGEANRLNHFVRKFFSTLHDFSQTERKKYRPASEYEFPTEGWNVFSDELKTKYPRYLNDKNQKIERWIQDDGTYHWWYDDELADALVILVAEDQIDNLLMMCNHPKIPLLSFFGSGWGRCVSSSENWTRLMSITLSSYLFFNITYATGDLDNGNWCRMGWYGGRTCYRLLFEYKYPADKITHRQFGDLWEAWSNRKGSEVDGGFRPDYDVLLGDLRRDWALMVKWDMLFAEMGALWRCPWRGQIVEMLTYSIGGLEEGEEGEDRLAKIVLTRKM